MIAFFFEILRSEYYSKTSFYAGYFCEFLIYASFICSAWRAIENQYCNDNYGNGGQRAIGNLQR